MSRPAVLFRIFALAALLFSAGCDNSVSPGGGPTAEKRPPVVLPTVSAEATTRKLFDCVGQKKSEDLIRYCSDEDARIFADKIRASETDPMLKLELLALRDADIIDERIDYDKAFVTISMDLAGSQETAVLPFDIINGEWKLVCHKSTTKMKLLDRMNSSIAVRRALFEYRAAKGILPGEPGVDSFRTLVSMKLLSDPLSYAVTDGPLNSESDVYWAYVGAGLGASASPFLPLLIEKPHYAVALGHLVVVALDGSHAQIKVPLDREISLEEAVGIYCEKRGGDRREGTWNTVFTNAARIDRAARVR